MGNNRKKTRGRLQPFGGCAHRGFGVVCHRCEQAAQLETRANDLAYIVKNKGHKFPEYVLSTKDANGVEQVIVKGGGGRFVGVISGHKSSVLSTVAELVHKMREHATYLKATKKTRSG